MTHGSNRAPTLKPGVVTGADYVTLVDACKSGGFALAAVNVANSCMLNAALEAAAETRTDIIIQVSNGGAETYGGKGIKNGLRAKVLGAVAAAHHVHAVAEQLGICVVLHTDHANRALVPWVDGLVDASTDWFRRTGKPLFSSHMLDLSEEPIEDNLRECERMMRRLGELRMSLEMELGVTGGEEDGIGHEVEDGGDNAHLYTQPEDVARAHQQLSPLGHFAVAASFGNVHGVYAPGNVKLRPEILRQAQDLVSKQFNTGKNSLNLVFHGGSGSGKAEISEAISYGVFKMNIDTDTQFAFASAVGGFVRQNERAFQYQIDPADGRPYKKLYDPRKWLRLGELGMKGRLIESFGDLGSLGKSLAAV